MILDGKRIAEELQIKIKTKILSLQKPPTLAVILVGNDPASETYVAMKQKSCKKVGITSHLIHLASSTTEKVLLEELQKLNDDPEINGILIQLPLPSHISQAAIFNAINPQKDVDCFHPMNVGKMVLGDTSGFLPCTPAGIQKLLIAANIEVASKHVVILGRSNLVGKPLALLLMQKAPGGNATVTVAHSQTKHLSALTQTADILIAAMGAPHFIQKEMVKEGAVIIDVGIHRTASGLIGDVDFATVAPKCSLITPVPGGVGPMTITMLLSNCLKAHH